jgi:hypothetical protein
MSEWRFSPPSRENPNGAVVGSVLDMPTWRQIIEREFVFQDIPDGDEVLDERPNGLVAYLREFCRIVAAPLHPHILVECDGHYERSQERRAGCTYHFHSEFSRRGDR